MSGERRGDDVAVFDRAGKAAVMAGPRRADGIEARRGRQQSLVDFQPAVGLPLRICRRQGRLRFDADKDENGARRLIAFRSVAAAQTHRVDAVFAPDVDDVYPPDAPPSPVVVPPVADGPALEDHYRPGHLPGVCAVLWRLFELTRPAAAVFGEKDWQQLQLARAVAQQHALVAREPLEIIPAPTVREPDGLAMSSRNRFLPADDRARAAAISQSLSLAAREAEPAAAERVMRTHMEDAGLLVEYASVRDAETLLEPAAGRPARALIAARLGEVRLIDNADWPPAMLRV